MATAKLEIRADLAARLQARAAQHNQSLDEMIEGFLETESAQPQPEDNEPARKRHPWESIIGILDTDETDLSISVRETLEKYSDPDLGWTTHKDENTD